MTSKIKHKALLLAVALFTTTAQAFTLQERTFQATVVRVTDGDSIVAHVSGWPLPFDPIEVRLTGIDTPESRKRDAKCTKELRLGLSAKAWMKGKLPPSTRITLVWTGDREKYGRLLSTVMLKDVNINQTLIRLGYAVAYDGGTKKSWCK
jgi:endonuclease YncB( thermonuclease family)